jgi:sugar phosphate isomerase/epimerase
MFCESRLLRMKTTRRSFLGALTAGTVCSAFAWEPPAQQLPIAFSTLACPAWDLAKILDFAAANGFAAIELRGLQGNLDLPSHPAFTPDHLEQTKQAISAHKLRIACVSSSSEMGESDPEKRAKGFADGRRFIDLAQTLQAPYVRVFGKSSDSEHPMTPSADLRKLVMAGLHELGTYASSRNVTVLLESHDDFTSAAVLKEVLERADSPHVGLLWDAFHTFATSNESPEVTVNALKPWIRHTHLKDAVGGGPNRKYVLTGRGNIPVRRQIEVLQHAGYKGYYCFEWEKVWHPELDDPEIAIADYARFMREYFAELKF